MPTEEFVLELQKIIEEDYGVKLNLKETREVATTLVDFFDLLTQINTQ